MLIKRILTNNAVVTLNEKNEEKIVCGKGIGFKKKSGDEIDIALIERTFILQNDGSLSKFEQILEDVPLEYIQLAYDIVTMAKLEFAKTFNDSMVATLSDHLYIAVKRCKEGMKISNALLYDIERFYDIEFSIGKRALDLIEETMHVRLPVDEAGFIALHIVSAQLDDTNMEYTFEVTKVIQEIITLVKYYFSIELDTGSAFYYRFITHLKFFAMRLLSEKQYEDWTESELLDIVKDKYEEAYQCSLTIRDHIRKIYHYELKTDEILYLTIHIHRVVKSGGEFMVVIGNHVTDVYDEVVELLGISESPAASAGKQNMSPVEMLMCDKVTQENLIDDRPLFRKTIADIVSKKYPLTMARTLVRIS